MSDNGIQSCADFLLEVTLSIIFTHLQSALGLAYPKKIKRDVTIAIF